MRILRLDVPHGLIDGLADVRSFRQPQDMVESCWRRQVKDAIGLIGGRIVHAGATPSPSRLFLQHSQLREKANLGKPQEDQAENGLGILGRGETRVRPKFVSRRPEAVLQCLWAGIFFARGDPFHSCTCRGEGRRGIAPCLAGTVAYHLLWGGLFLGGLVTAVAAWARGRCVGMVVAGAQSIKRASTSTASGSWLPSKIIPAGRLPATPTRGAREA